uniref:Uncharacterized protein n=1 Tax=Rheinheimera sp. BAL341 TaxID=1708203 RepID=A0A486XSI9_9GAMM
MKYVIFLLIKVAMLLLSFGVFASGDDHLAPRNPEKIVYQNLQGSLDTDGYELKRLSYISVNGKQINKELFFINSANGARLAYRNAGLSFVALEDALQDFNSPFRFSQRTSSSSSAVNASTDASDGMLMIIDKEIDAISTQTQADAYISKWGLAVEADSDAFDAATLTSEYGTSCPRKWRCRTKSYQKNNINETLDETFELYRNSYGSVNLDVDGTVNASVNAQLDYRYKKKFGIIYKVRVDFLDSSLDYRFNGAMKLTGNVNQNFTGREFELFQAKIYDQIFMVGFIPVQVDIKTYVRAGTGDLKLSASGAVGMLKPVHVEGRFSYVCDARNCVKQNESFNNFNESLGMNNIGYQVLAKAEIEPYVNAAVRGRLYWGTIYAEVGLQPSIPVKLFGYVGNLCGDGDGKYGNENVKAGIISADIRAGVTLKGRYFLYKTDRYYKEFYRGALAYKDLLNPSTALSPIIRPVVSGTDVRLTTSLRSCVANELDKKFQDFTIHWGNGTSTELADVAGSVEKSKSLTPGNYTIKVQHASGAYTQRSIVIETPGDGIGAPGECKFKGHGGVCEPVVPVPTH